MESANQPTNHLAFNFRCKSENLIPRSLQIKPLVKSTEGRKIAEKASRLFLLERIQLNHHDHRRVNGSIGRLVEDLRSSLSQEDFDRISQISHESAEQTFQQTKTRHLNKIERLKNCRVKTTGRDNLCLEPEYRMKGRWLVNLSNNPLTQDEEDVLKLGLSFAPAPKKASHIDFVAAVQTATKRSKLPLDDAEELKSRVCGVRSPSETEI